MKVIEYRKKYPNCKYCNHISTIKPTMCCAKIKRVFFNKAKRCPMYIPTGIITDVEE